MKILRLWPALLLFTGIGITTARSDDRVSGTFTVKGKTAELHHVYAFWKPRITDESKLDLYVLLSDETIAPHMLPKDDDGLSKIAALVREDKIHAIELHFDGPTDRLFEGEQGAVYHNGIAMARQGETGMLVYHSEKAGAGRKAGRLLLDKSMASQFEWNVIAVFDVAVPAKP